MNGTKYKNKKIEVDGYIFDSTREGKVYSVLKDFEKNSVIHKLIIHPKWELIPPIREKYIKHLKTKDKECERTIQLGITYTSDFSFEYKNKLYVIDVKISPKMIPKEYVLKKKMMRYFHNIDVIEIYKPTDINNILLTTE